MSVRALLAIVAFCALASVALVRASDVWASLMFSGALGVISLAVLAAILRRGAKQAFWIGFALFGWLYLWMAHWRSDPDVQFGPNVISWRMQQDETGSLATTKFLAYVYSRWLPTVRTPPAPQPTPTTVSLPGYGGYGGAGGGGYGQAGYGQTGYGGAGYGAPASRRVRVGYGATAAAPQPAPTPAPVDDYPLQHNFTRVGHSLFTIMLAFLGGLVATWLYQTRDPATK
jgi:hypothetical protein